MTRPRRPAGPVPPVVLVASAAFAASATFHGAFGTWAFLPAAGLGAAGAGAVALFARWRRLLLGETVALSVPAFVLLGTVAVGGMPSGTALGDLLDGLVGGWVDLLSVTPPVTLAAPLRALPFATAWLGAMIGTELLRIARLPALAIAGPLTALVVGVLVGAEDRPVALTLGAGLAAVAIVLSLLQQRRRAAMEEEAGEAAAGRVVTRRHPWRAAGAAASLLAAVVALAPLVGPRLPLASAHERFELRDHRTPPWDPLEVPSPLVQLKASLKEDRAEQVVFTVRADAPLTRWPVATLGSFDGVVWTVAGSGETTGGSFLPVDRALPAAVDAGATIAAGLPVTAEVEIASLGGTWLPRPGVPAEVDILTGTASLRYNPSTWTVAAPDGVAEGLRYRMRAVQQAEPDDAARRASTMVPEDRGRELNLVPPAVRDLAADLVEGEPYGWAQVEAIRDRFVTEGFYDRTDAARPGHSNFRLSEFLDDPQRIVGFEEQYAAAAAVLARVAQVPARVVVGYVVPAERWVEGRAEVLAGDISAWIEVRTDQYGWIPVDVTPDRSREPTEQNLGITVKNVAVPNPPTPPPPPQDVQLPEQPEEQPDAEEDEQDEEAPAGGFAWRYVAYGGAAAAPLVLVVAALATIAALKARRTARRRRAAGTAQQVAGAWQETIERYVEGGVAVPDKATSREVAYALAGGRPDDAGLERTLVSLAARVDEAAFSPVEPAPHDAAAAWELADRAVESLHAERTRLARYRATCDPRPLLRRDPVRTAAPKER